MKNLHIRPRFFAQLALAFVFATIAGTVTHELGHYCAIKYYGGHPVLHYASVSPGTTNDNTLALRDRYQKNKDKIMVAAPSPEKEAYMAYRAQLGEKLKYSILYLWLAGPLQTMLTGTLGAVILYTKRKKINAIGMRTVDWFWVILAFFWSRQFLNLLTSIFQYFKHCKCVGNGDEAKISRYFGWPILTLNSITGFIAAAILCWIVLIVIPKKQRFTFIIAGLTGSILGWLVWMKWIGPVLLP